MRDRPDIDLTQSHFERRYGDITVFGTWIGKQRTPALVLIPTNYRAGHFVPCVVPLSMAHEWSQSLGDPIRTADVSILFAESLGLNPLSNSPITITLAIQDCIGDLINIPPKPTETFVAADAVVTDASGKTHHAEIIDHV